MTSVGIEDVESVMSSAMFGISLSLQLQGKALRDKYRVCKFSLRDASVGAFPQLFPCGLDRRRPTVILLLLI